MQLMQFSDLPQVQQRMIEEMNIQEDPPEDPIIFDAGIDFWGAFANTSGFDHEQWQMCLRYVFLRFLPTRW
jgi:hypothetical protein